jgi:hypothetical protein
MLLHIHLVQFLSLQVNPETIKNIRTEIRIETLCIPLRLKTINIGMDKLCQPPILPLFDKTELGERIDNPKSIDVPPIPAFERVFIIFLSH